MVVPTGEMPVPKYFGNRRIRDLSKAFGIGDVRPVRRGVGALPLMRDRLWAYGLRPPTRLGIVFISLLFLFSFLFSQNILHKLALKWELQLIH